jgi:hypothetical protein
VADHVLPDGGAEGRWGVVHALRLGLTLAAGASLALASAAPATQLIVSFTGSVSIVDPALASQFAIGDPIAGTVVYESTTPDIQPDPTFAVYSGAVGSGAFMFGSYSATGSSGSITVQLGTSSDSFEAFVGSVTGAPVGSFAVTDLGLRLEDSSATVFPDDSLPTSLDLADFDIARATIGFDDGNSFALVLADLSALSVTPVSVPEPSAAGLVAGAFAWFAWRRRRPA